jgi:hypothetical protein
MSVLQPGPGPSLFLRRPDLDHLPPLDLPDGYALRAATDADADAMAEMLGGAFPEMSWTAGNVRERLLEDPTVRATFVIDQDGVPVATASARIMPDAYPGSGYVHALRWMHGEWWSGGPLAHSGPLHWVNVHRLMCGLVTRRETGAVALAPGAYRGTPAGGAVGRHPQWFVVWPSHPDR